MSIATGAVFGVVLHDLMNQVQQTIVDAENAGSNLIAEAGREVQHAIDSARNAYAECLNQTMDRISQIMKQSIDQLTAMVQELVEKNEEVLRSTAQKAQQFVNTLPFAQQRPQLISAVPRCIAPSSSRYNVGITLMGNFPFVSDEECRPSIEVNSQKFSPISTTTQEMKFSLPNTAFIVCHRIVLNTETYPRIVTTIRRPDFRMPAISAGSALPPLDSSRVSLLNATLNIPWKRREPSLVGREVIQIDTFNLSIGVLPIYVGKIACEYSVTQTVTEYKDFVQGRFHLDATHHDQENKEFVVPAEEGWKIVRGTSSIKDFDGDGVYSYPTFVSDYGDRVIYKASADHRSWHERGDSGVIDFSIAFKESRETSITQQSVTNLQLKWGDAVVLTHNITKIVFDAFDGSHQEFASSTRHKYLIIENLSTNVWRIQARLPDELSPPPVTSRF